MELVNMKVYENTDKKQQVSQSKSISPCLVQPTKALHLLHTNKPDYQHLDATKKKSHSTKIYCEMTVNHKHNVALRNTDTSIKTWPTVDLELYIQFGSLVLKKADECNKKWLED